MSREAPPATQPNTPSSMDAIAQIQGVQDIITSKLPINSLSIIGKTSSKWEAPAKEISIVKVQEEILAFNERVSTWVSFQPFTSKFMRLCWATRTTRSDEGWWLFTGKMDGHRTPSLLLDFIRKNKIGGVRQFKELKRQFLEQVELEKWVLDDPRRKHHKIPEGHPINVIHQQGVIVFDHRIQMEESKQEILTLLQFLFPERIENAGKKLADFTHSTKPYTMVKNLRKILHCIPHAKIRTLLD